MNSPSTHISSTSEKRDLTLSEQRATRDFEDLRPAVLALLLRAAKGCCDGQYRPVAPGFYSLAEQASAILAVESEAVARATGPAEVDIVEVSSFDSSGALVFDDRNDPIHHV